MARTSLRTIICGVPAGTLTQDENGLISFTYDHDYDGPALSTNIPVSNRTYGQQVMNPYLFGLLPDSEDQRKAIAAEFDVRPNNPVALLSHIGLDCPGGVQFCAEEDADAVPFDTLKAICEAVSIPVVAIGGISKDNLSNLAGSGVDGVALVSAIFSADDITGTCKLLRTLSERMVEP